MTKLSGRNRIVVFFAIVVLIIISSFIISQTFFNTEQPPIDLSLTISTTTGGSTNPAPGVYSFKYGYRVTINALPNEGFIFNNWIFDGETLEKNPITITMNNNYSMKAVFTESPIPSPSPTPQPTTTPSPIPSQSPPSPTPSPSPNPLPTPPPDTSPKGIGEVTIDNQLFTFDPTEVVTIRPDLFNPGFFSMFDVIVHLDLQGLISLEYHFDETMNTHIIDSLNGEPNWWYTAYYSGGWSERNVFRLDHYPWKDRTTLSFYKTSPSALTNIYSVWKDEVIRRNTNSRKVVIPQVIIRVYNDIKEFEDVEVTPHNLRSDIFHKDVITAMDVILSLGDQGKITYELQWYETIATANIVKNYWVEAIDTYKAEGRSGFVYEAGSIDYSGFLGNHIHLPSDSRMLNSPEYVLFYWIDL